MLLIDATTLWSDELYTVGKSFQPSLRSLLVMLREDTHPPAYYVLLWFWGNLVGQSPISLRFLSWLAYLAGGFVMVLQAMALGGGRLRVAAIAALLAFCSPYPIRFAIEGKSYAVLVLFVALAWWWRRSGHPIAYGAVAGLAGLTHFYGLFLVLAAAAWDGWQRRWTFAAAALIGVIPALAWMAYAADYLFSSRAASWIGVPDYALFEETLARGLGLWPLPKLALILLLLELLRRWGGLRRIPWPAWNLLDRSGLIPSLLMVLGVVVVSFVKPMAFSRYFVVLLPAVVPVLSVQIGGLELNRFGRGCGLVVLGLILASWWGPGFSELDAGLGGVREQDQFRQISQRTSGLEERYSPRERLFNLSDRMEAAMGRIPSPSAPWGGKADLKQRLQGLDQPQQLWLASSGPPLAMKRKLKPLQSQVELAGFRCEPQATDLTHARLLRCRSESMGLSK
ncbi:glycosyltransferase family 39 protein [Synechococcus sp. UW69]|uniref:glycosyltransferase family 39 protein n=1 Tax=Synechococcus sp. UW69 TaxID=368493 RepID=UPI001FCB6632|nr:glycosyltransferase family 39 protein [Synechococcus sp. UW69]